MGRAVCGGGEEKGRPGGVDCSEERGALRADCARDGGIRAGAGGGPRRGGRQVASGRLRAVTFIGMSTGEHNFGFATRALHAGQQPYAITGARAMPIYQTTSDSSSTA